MNIFSTVKKTKKRKKRKKTNNTQKLAINTNSKKHQNISSLFSDSEFLFPHSLCYFFSINFSVPTATMGFSSSHYYRAAVIAIFLAVTTFAASSSAARMQLESELAPAMAPVPIDTGAGTSVTVSGALICFLLFSFAGLLQL